MEQESHPYQHFADRPIIDRDLVPLYDLTPAAYQRIVNDLVNLVSICTRNCTTILQQRCTTFAARCAIEKSATLQQHCTTNLQQRCTTIECTIHGCNQHGETPPGVMDC